MSLPTTYRLRAGTTEAVVCPAAGGSLASFASEVAGRRREWLRPAASEALAGRDPLGMSMFPLVPYSNRIRAGRFRFDGRDVSLPPNMPPEA